MEEKVYRRLAILALLLCGGSIIIGIIGWRVCSLDVCALVNGLLLGIVASGMASLGTYLIINYHDTKVAREKYGKSDGQYFGYRFEKNTESDKNRDCIYKIEEDCIYQSNDFRWTLESDPCSRATIEYKHGNVLHIKLTELNDRGLAWEGFITMELENRGSLVWQYINLPEGEHRFGFKRCIMGSRGDEFYLYLIGEYPYGLEVLKKIKK